MPNLEVIINNENALSVEVDSNLDELEIAIAEKIDYYMTHVYGEDDIALVKGDRATLNKVIEALNSKRISLEKTYMSPFNIFKGKANKIIATIGTAVAKLDEIDKAYIEKKKAEKKLAIEEMFGCEVQDLSDIVSLSKVWKDTWLNAGTLMSNIKKEMQAYFSVVSDEIEVVKNAADPEFKEEVTALYNKTLDLTAALLENTRLVSDRRRMEEFAAKQVADAKVKAEAEGYAKAKAEAERISRETAEAKAAEAKADMDKLIAADRARMPATPVTTVNAASASVAQSNSSPYASGRAETAVEVVAIKDDCIEVSFCISATNSQVEDLAIFLQDNNISYSILD